MKIIIVKKRQKGGGGKEEREREREGGGRVGEREREESMWPDEVLCVYITCTDVGFEIMLYHNITTHTILRVRVYVRAFELFPGLCTRMNLRWEKRN